MENRINNMIFQNVLYNQFTSSFLDLYSDGSRIHLHRTHSWCSATRETHLSRYILCFDLREI